MATSEHMDIRDAHDRKQCVRLVVVGIGGAGVNAVNRMSQAGLSGVTLVAMNTDTGSLQHSAAHHRLVLGTDMTRGRGTGGNAQLGEDATQASRTEIRQLLKGADMVFIAAGMGGGTGTGGAPVVAEIAVELGILTVAVVSRPFSFEGPRRAHVASKGIEALKSQADTVIVVPNDRLFELDATKLTLAHAFEKADDVLRHGVQGIADIITLPGQINVDFADVRATLKSAGTAMMGIGEAEGDGRGIHAAEQAVSSPLLETSISGAMRALINVTSGPDLTLVELNESVSFVTGKCDPREAKITFGWVLDPGMEGTVRVTVLATGFDDAASSRPRLLQFEAQRSTPTGAAQQPTQLGGQPRMPAPSRGELPIPEAPREPEADSRPIPVSVQTLLASQTEGPLDATDESEDDDLDRPAFWRRR